MLVPATTIDVGFAIWQPWTLLAWLMQFGFIIFGFMFSPSCGCCGKACSLCTSTPQNLQVDITGVADGSPTECEQINGTWILSPVVQCDTTSPSLLCCIWYAATGHATSEFISNPAGVMEVGTGVTVSCDCNLDDTAPLVRITLSGNSAPYSIGVRYVRYPDGQSAGLQAFKTTTSSDPCDDLLGSYTPSAFPGGCDVSVATVVVSVP